MSWIFFALDQPGPETHDLDVFDIQDFSMAQDSLGQWWVYGTLRSSNTQQEILYDFRRGIKWLNLFNNSDQNTQEDIVRASFPRMVRFYVTGQIS